MKFEQLGLAEPILRAIAAEGYAHPTPIQVKAIPHVLAGSDLLGCAQTGTGKTAAFALPILHRLSGKTAHAPVAGSPHATNGHAHAHASKTNSHSRSHLRALVLCPTRELAAQIADSFRAYGRNMHLKHTVVFGGVNQNPQVRALRAGVDILIATPGRLLDLMQQGFVDLRAIEVLVLDEADRMLDMGFIPDIRRIVKQIPTKRQTLLFSATMPGDIRALADSILRNPISVQVNPVASTVETIAQSVYFVTRQHKPALLTHLLKKGQTKGEIGRTLVFTRTKHGADKVVRHLERGGIRAEAIHGNKSQNARMRALQSFKSSKPPVLVATDIASRGIDVDDITHVINFDIPNVPETYVHRIGRTARAGASGVAVSFCDHEERGDLKAIERLTRITIQVNRDQPDLSAEITLLKAAARDDDRTHALRHNGDRAHAHSHGHAHSRDDRSPRHRKSSSPSKRNTSHATSQPAAHGKHAAHGHGHAHAHGHAAAGSNQQQRSFAQRGRGRGRGGSGTRAR